MERERPAFRRCATCGEAKPLSAAYFIPKAGYRWGLSRSCKACRNAALLRRRQTDPQFVARTREYAQAYLARRTEAQRQADRARMARWRREHPDRVRAYGEAQRRRKHAHTST